ncbi:MAG: hypothetical protein ABIG89_05415 [Candidatus Woesearchaeota archaeon]
MSFDNIIHYVANPTEITGIDIVLPMLLFFIILFVGLNNTKIMKKNQAIVVAIILSFITVLPHITNTYPPCYDPVTMINNAVPQFGLMILVLFTFLIILFVIGIRDYSSRFWTGILAIGSFAFIAYTFYASKSGYYMELCAGPTHAIPFAAEVFNSGWFYVIIIIVTALLLMRFMRGNAGGGTP